MKKAWDARNHRNTQERYLTNSELKTIIENILRDLKKQFEDTHDPFYIWKAIETLDKAGDYPLWVKNYLKITANKLLAINRKGNKFPDQVVSCLGIRAKSISKNITTNRDILNL